MADKRERA
uniref:Uncharacterized protein n=1 Tax=Rhizophora mucronata TaxID=61149 RepID=A0A2P2N7Q3_RHIMU